MCSTLILDRLPDVEWSNALTGWNLEFGIWNLRFEI